MKGGGENAIARHTLRNRKVLVRDRLRMLLDDEDYLELSPFAGLDLPYGDIPSAGCLTGNILHNTVKSINMYYLWLIKNKLKNTKLGIKRI